MSNLTTAIMIAAEAHENQTDKAGEPYILHPLRVMLAVPDRYRIAAVLHDVAEDYDAGWARIHDGGFSDDDKDAIDALTRRDDETYATFIDRCKANPIARRVKIADIHDNLRPDNSDGHESRRLRYGKALDVLTASYAEEISEC